MSSQARGTSLVEVVAQAASIEQQLIEAGGEISPALEIALSAVDLQIAHKVDAYLHVCDRLEIAAEQWKDRAAEYAKIGQALGKSRELIRARLKEAMKTLKRDEVPGIERRIKLQKGAPKLDIVEDQVPAAYLLEETTYSPDKERIKADLEEGKEIAGCKLVPTTVLRDYANRSAKAVAQKDDVA